MPGSPEQPPDPADWATVWHSEPTAPTMGLDENYGKPAALVPGSVNPYVQKQTKGDRVHVRVRQ